MLPGKQKPLRSVSPPSDLRISATERNGPAPGETVINKEKTDIQIAQYVTRITPAGPYLNKNCQYRGSPFKAISPNVLLA